MKLKGNVRTRFAYPLLYKKYPKVSAIKEYFNRSHIGASQWYVDGDTAADVVLHRHYDMLGKIVLIVYCNKLYGTVIMNVERLKRCNGFAALEVTLAEYTDALMWFEEARQAWEFLYAMDSRLVDMGKAAVAH